MVGSSKRIRASGSYSHEALATTINGITLTSPNIFADNRSINDVGITDVGFVLQFGGDIAGGSAGYSSAGIFTPTGSSTPTLTQSLSPCGPLTTDENFCERSYPLSATTQNGTCAFEVESLPIPSGTTTTSIFPLPSVARIPLTPRALPS